MGTFRVIRIQLYLVSAAVIIEATKYGENLRELRHQRHLIPSMGANQTSADIKTKHLRHSNTLFPAYDISGYDPPSKLTSRVDDTKSSERLEQTRDFRLGSRRNKLAIQDKEKSDQYSDDFNRLPDSVVQLRPDGQTRAKIGRNKSVDIDLKTINMLVNVLTWAHEQLNDQSKLNNSTSVTPSKAQSTAKRQRSSKNDPFERPSASINRISARRIDQVALGEARFAPATTTMRPDRFGRHDYSTKDHVMVRAGFGRGLNEQPTRNQTHDERRGKTTTDKRRRQSAMMQSGAHHNPSNSILGEDLDSLQPQVEQNSGPSLLAMHRPILARDLLTHQPERGYEYSTGSNPIAPENLFVSRPRQIHAHEKPAGGLTGLNYRPYEADISLNQIERDERPIQGDYNPMVPPYNGHPLLGHLRHPLTGLSGQSNWIGANQSPMRHPGDSPESDPSDKSDRPATGSVTGLHPLEHMLEVAKRQREAALAFERRRLEHELALDHRQGQIRHQHELELEKQRKDHELKAQQAAREAKEAEDRKNKEKQEQEENGDQGNQQEGQNRDDDRQGNQSNEVDDEGGSQGFSDTDFTDLFPPGILSEAEIKEIKKQQQEEREKEKQRRQQESEQQQDEQEANQEPEDDADSNQESSAGQEAGKANSEVGESVEQTNETGGDAPTSSSRAENGDKKSEDRGKPEELRPINGSHVEYAHRANKTRRSRSRETPQSSQSIRDEYVRPFMLPAIVVPDRRLLAKVELDSEPNAQVHFDGDNE